MRTAECGMRIRDLGTLLVGIQPELPRSAFRISVISLGARDSSPETLPPLDLFDAAWGPIDRVQAPDAAASERRDLADAIVDGVHVPM
jgi:hypothetical protein